MTAATDQSMKVPILDLKAQYAEVGPELEEAAVRVLRSTQYILGPDVAAFEREAAAYIGVRHVVGLSSGTDSLVVAPFALGDGRGHQRAPTLGRECCQCRGGRHRLRGGPRRGIGRRVGHQVPGLDQLDPHRRRFRPDHGG